MSSRPHTWANGRGFDDPIIISIKTSPTIEQRRRARPEVAMRIESIGAFDKKKEKKKIARKGPKREQAVEGGWVGQGFGN